MKKRLKFLNLEGRPEGKWYDEEMLGHPQRQRQLAIADPNMAMRLARTYKDRGFAKQITKVYSDDQTMIHSVAAMAAYFGIKVERTPVIQELAAAPSSYCPFQIDSGHRNTSHNPNWKTQS